MPSESMLKKKPQYSRISGAQKYLENIKKSVSIEDSSAASLEYSAARRESAA